MQFLSYNRCSVNIFQNKERKVCAHKQETNAFGFLKRKKGSFAKKAAYWKQCLENNQNAHGSLKGRTRSSWDPWVEAPASTEVPHTEAMEVRLNRDWHVILRDLAEKCGLKSF